MQAAQAKPFVALQCSGHLRELCVGENFEALADTIFHCRRVANCDLFIHTWRTLNPGTASWSVANASTLDLQSLSLACVRRIDRNLFPAAMAIEAQASDARQVVPSLGTAKWFKPGTLAGQIALAGIRASVRAAGQLSSMRRSHELFLGRPYDIVVRMRPDMYRPLIAKPVCWEGLIDRVMAPDSASPGRVNGSVWGCSKQLGRKNSDACFFGRRDAMDRFLEAWEAVVERELHVHLCWQRQVDVGHGDSSSAQDGPSRAATTCGGKPAHLPEALLVLALREARVRGRWSNCSADSCECS